ncbi:MAG: tetratricopeptide repeat protein [Paludibacteraceae bacterium]|nr:tetratricopeptide repeat protein [Paludibacteraceae bacterium]
MQSWLNDIYKLLRSDMIASALLMIEQNIDPKCYDLKKRCDSLFFVCKQYYSYSDKSFGSSIISNVLSLADDVSMGQVHPKSLESDALNELLKSDDFRTIGSASNDTALSEVFSAIVYSRPLSNSNISNIQDIFFSDSNLDAFSRDVITYALLIRCLRSFDSQIFYVLLSIGTPVAYVAVAALYVVYAERISIDEKLSYECDTLEGNSSFIYALFYIYVSSRTIPVADDFHNNLLPKLLRQNMEILKNHNPDDLESSGMVKYMECFNELNKKGIDVYYDTFRQMKFFPFFTEPAHWFFSLDFRYHLIAGEFPAEVENISRALGRSSICDSDRYSLLFTMKGADMTSVSSMLSSYGINKADELVEQLDDREDWQGHGTVSTNELVRFSVMNLFRFFKLSRDTMGAKSPFDFRSTDSPLFTSLLSLADRNAVASLLYEADDWDSALLFWHDISDSLLDNDFEIYRKTGYCFEQCGKYAEAAGEYNKYDIISPDDLWNLRHLANAFYLDGNYFSSLRIYERLLTLSPDDVETLSRLSSLHLSFGHPDKAKPFAYKLEYLHPDNDEYSYMLGRCLLFLDERDEAYKYFSKIEEVPRNILLSAFCKYELLDKVVPDMLALIGISDFVQLLSDPDVSPYLNSEILRRINIIILNNHN